MRAPLAPPRLSVPRNVEADAHAVFTNCDTLKPDFKTRRFKFFTSAAVRRLPVAFGTGSCQMSSSFGTNLPT